MIDCVLLDEIYGYFHFLTFWTSFNFFNLLTEMFSLQQNKSNLSTKTRKLMISYRTFITNCHRLCSLERDLWIFSFFNFLNFFELFGFFKLKCFLQQNKTHLSTKTSDNLLKVIVTLSQIVTGYALLDDIYEYFHF